MGLRDRLAVDEQRHDDDNDLAKTYRERLLEEVDVDELARLSPSQRRVRLERVLSRILSVDGPVLSARERGALVQRITDDALGLGVLEPLLADESVTEIMVNGSQDVFVERYGKVERVPTRFASVEQLYQTIDRIVSQVNRRVDESSPMVDARLPSGERVNVIIPPLALDGPTLTIRRFPTPFRMGELVDKGTLDTGTASLLGACVRARLNIVVSGGTGSGKTTFLNALSGMIPDHERIVTIEDAAELSLQQSHVVRLESRPANVEGRGAVTVRELVRNTLRMRPDRIIVGEVRGGETMDMLQAMNTGHDGSVATVHANTARDALGRLETLASMSEIELPAATLRDQINSAIDLIVHLERAEDGSRRVVEVQAVTSQRREEFALTPLVRFARDPIGPDRTVTGTFVPSPAPKQLLERLHRAGETVPVAEPPVAEPVETAGGGTR
ncbi:pilus assembly protein CpaF [Promicromonospora sp. AC04]|uniref:CpaF family protein n=1 Tax=Promicromonospora sp. AC04 TaxID=2135723 RepID=UPI000D3517BD|nr:CpaF family protein [Promicromonospora sp. AC04]PUB30159.1 pilus assembly protein CpaF [Promicromonospora sp. AC04]